MEEAEKGLQLCNREANRSEFEAPTLKNGGKQAPYLEGTDAASTKGWATVTSGGGCCIHGGDHGKRDCPERSRSKTGKGVGDRGSISNPQTGRGDSSQRPQIANLATGPNGVPSSRWLCRVRPAALELTTPKQLGSQGSLE